MTVFVFLFQIVYSKDIKNVTDTLEKPSFWIAGRGNVRTHHAKRGRGLQPVNTSLSPGALSATAVRSGLWRHTADAQACLTMSLFIQWLYEKSASNVWIFKRNIIKDTSRERIRVSIRGLRCAYTQDRKLRKSFKVLTWPFLQRSAHILVPSPPLISTW